MKWSYRIASIQGKLGLLVVTSTLAALLLAGTAIVTYDAIALRRNLVREMTTTAEMMAHGTMAALAFNDKIAAQEALRSLRAKHSVVVAVIENSSGEVIARYRREGAPAVPIIERGATARGHRFEGGQLVLWRSIGDSTGRLGTIVIQSTLAELRQHVAQFVPVALGFAALSCVAATLLSSRLQRSVSRPIRSLAEVATEIERGDFTQRASKLSEDETGALVDAFNGMLAKIQQRDQDLAHYRNELEELVEKRTEQLARSQESLRRSERLASVGTLAAGIAHQINNPVGAILNSAQFALLCENDDDFAHIWKEALTRNAEEALRCGRIVRSILQFSRNESTQKWEENLNEICRRACKLCETYAAERGASLDYQATDAPAIILCSPIEMEQVLVNILRNALEAVPHGSGVVCLGLESDDRSVRVEIRDNGCGIESSDLGHIFDPFYTTRLESGGTGLGLSISHGIISDHGGTIEVESNRESGTVVSIWLPTHRVESSEPGATPSS